MASTNKTQLLNLNQWIGTDKVKRVDFVDDNKIIDDWFKKMIKSVRFSNNKLILTTYDNRQEEINILQEADNNSKGVVDLNTIKTMIDNARITIPEATENIKGIVSLSQLKRLITDNAPRTEFATMSDILENTQGVGVSE